jgi:hypothetical protein
VCTVDAAFDHWLGHDPLPFSFLARVCARCQILLLMPIVLMPKAAHSLAQCISACHVRVTLACTLSQKFAVNVLNYCLQPVASPVS